MEGMTPLARHARVLPPRRLDRLPPDPQRVTRASAWPATWGNEAKTVQNLQLYKILAEEGCILVRGSIPGAKGDYVVVQKAATRTTYKLKGVGKEEVRSKNPLKASKKAAAGRG
jgi:large subunit ribosomal protein L3